MRKELLNQAAVYFNSGDKNRAEEIFFQLVHEEPENADAWFGLAMCTQIEDERVRRLEKCLAIQSNHHKARKALDVILSRRYTQPESIPSAPMLASTGTYTQEVNQSNENQNAIETQKTFSPHWIYSPIILLLICFSIWQFIRIDQLEKSTRILGDNDRNILAGLNSTNDFVHRLAANLDITKSDVSRLSAEIDSQNGNIRMLARGLDYVTPLAENANMFAHSHSYSDERLKTEIVTIDDPISKIMQLRGVYYYWKTAKYPQMGFDSDLQVGVIAQEVERVFPELVAPDPNGYKQVDYEKLSAVLIEAVKEQQNEIETLKNRVDQIEGK